MRVDGYKLITIDVDHFGPDAGSFNPERWLSLGVSTDDDYTEKPTSSLAHLSFGAGSRSCPGATIASRLIYTALFRLLSLYKFEASESDPPNTDYVEYNAIKSALVAIPRDFKVKLTPRNEDLAKEVLQSAEERTRGLYKE
jgi:phenylacetate 2-hydroxylase